MYSLFITDGRVQIGDIDEYDMLDSDGPGRKYVTKELNNLNIKFDEKRKDGIFLKKNSESEPDNISKDKLEELLSNENFEILGNKNDIEKLLGLNNSPYILGDSIGLKLPLLTELRCREFGNRIGLNSPDDKITVKGFSLSNTSDKNVCTSMEQISHNLKAALNKNKINNDIMSKADKILSNDENLKYLRDLLVRNGKCKNASDPCTIRLDEFLYYLYNAENIRHYGKPIVDNDKYRVKTTLYGYNNHRYESGSFEDIVKRGRKLASNPGRMY